MTDKYNNFKREGIFIMRGAECFQLLKCVRQRTFQSTFVNMSHKGNEVFFVTDNFER